MHCQAVATSLREAAADGVHLTGAAPIAASAFAASTKSAALASYGVDSVHTEAAMIHGQRELLERCIDAGGAGRHSRAHRSWSSGNGRSSAHQRLLDMARASRQQLALHRAAQVSHAVRERQAQDKPPRLRARRQRLQHVHLRHDVAGTLRELARQERASMPMEG